MKKNTLIALLAIASLTFLSVSCTPGSNPSPSGNSNDTNWSWWGNAPLSLEVDGVHYQATQGVITHGTGDMQLIASNSSDTGVTITFTGVPAINAIYNCPTDVNIHLNIGPSTSYTSYQALSDARVKVLDLTDTTIEGMFYGTVEDTTTSTTHKLTHGYFKVLLF